MSRIMESDLTPLEGHMVASAADEVHDALCRMSWATVATCDLDIYRMKEVTLRRCLREIRAEIRKEENDDE